MLDTRAGQALALPPYNPRIPLPARHKEVASLTLQPRTRSHSPSPSKCYKLAHKDAAHVLPELDEPSADTPGQPPLSPEQRQLRPRSPAHADPPGCGASPQRSRPAPELWRVTYWVLAGMVDLGQLLHGVLHPSTLHLPARLPQLYQLGSLTFLYACQLDWPDLNKALGNSIGRFLNIAVPKPCWMQRVTSRNYLSAPAQALLRTAKARYMWLHESLGNPALASGAFATGFRVMKRLPDPLQQAVALAFAGKMAAQGPVSQDNQAGCLSELARAVWDTWDAVAS